MSAKLVLIDSHAVIHRAYHALPQTLTNRHGQPINAVYGFAKMILRVVDELKPNYLVAAFDLPEPTFRHQAFMGYQANRPKTDEELISQFELVKQLVDTFGILRFERVGFEADDLIGTLACQATKKKMKTVIVTGDKDILQLVSDSVEVFLMRQGISQVETLDREGVRRILGVWPEQVVDYKALVGDSSDNYPGVPGVGPKTAEKLLGEYKGYRQVYDHLSDLPASLAEKLEKNRSLADLSYQLAKIETKAPVKLPGKKDVWRLDRERAGEFIETLGFKSLLRKLEEPKNKSDSEKEQLSLI